MLGTLFGALAGSVLLSLLVFGPFAPLLTASGCRISRRAAASDRLTLGGAVLAAIWYGRFGRRAWEVNDMLDVRNDVSHPDYAGRDTPDRSEAGGD